MRINIYSQELTDEVKMVHKEGKNEGGIITLFKGVRLYLHSTHRLHDFPNGDDRSAITLWLPKSDIRRWELVNALRSMAQMVENEIDVDIL